MRCRATRHVIGLILLPALLLGAAVFATSEIQRDSALHAATAEQQAQRLLTAMLDQETGARGYFGTRDPVFLEPWYKGTTDFAIGLRQAEATDGGDPQLLNSLRAQGQVAYRWHADAAAAIVAIERGHQKYTVTAALGRKAIMDQFRALNSNFSSLLAARRNRALSESTLLSVLVAVVLAVTLAFGGLALLGRVRRREERRRGRETELREMLQASDSEEESRLLLIRHIERTVPGAGATVLNRNNSDDRLEPTLGTSGAPSPLAALPRTQLQPRACLAVRLSRPHGRSHSEEPLAQCEVCGRLAGDVACEPLLVGGNVIGSVLVAREGRIGADLRGQVRDAVAQAAPIIANQRNLSLAELRAASDALTGLPNRRAADDTLKRMVAHAGRTLSPLSAIIVDLDHFKQVNDLHGHEQGDEVLAAVGQVLAASLRASDFAARFGGEEFLVLLPDTSRDQARGVAEKLRVAVAATDVACGQVTASFGVASLPDDAVYGDALLRRADSALYVAKHNGRNRVELALPRSIETSEAEL